MWMLVGLICLLGLVVFLIKKISELDEPTEPQRFAEWGEIVLAPPTLIREHPDKRFVTKVAGVSKRNRNRTSRQAILKQIVKECEREGFYPGITLVREPDNEFDSNAIAIIDTEERQIGYVAAHVAFDLSRQIDNGYRVEARIDDVFGGEDGKSLGCLLEVDIYNRKDSA